MKIFILFGITFASVFFKNVISDAIPLPYEAIFNFGDSISDTGNAEASFPPLDKNSPYGSTFFKHPSGRMSNGRIIIDFIVGAYGLPFLVPYLNPTKDNGDIKKGVNFAFSGASALDMEYYTRTGVKPPPSNMSLSIQLDWFKKLKPSLCKTKEECDIYFKNTLFLVGEIGGNDVVSHIRSQKTVEQLREVVPLIVDAITKTTSALIEEGAVELAVPGNFPMGCSAAVLTIVNSMKKEDYDDLGCLIAYNTFVEYFEEQLKNSIEMLKQKYPQAKIMYFDYYNDVKRLYQQPQQYGFIADKVEILKACCGGSGPYRVDDKYCGQVGTTICPDPSKMINWDGSHLTEAAYKQIAKGLIEGPFAIPALKPAPFNIA